MGRTELGRLTRLLAASRTIHFVAQLSRGGIALWNRLSHPPRHDVSPRIMSRSFPPLLNRRPFLLLIFSAVLGIARGSEAPAQGEFVFTSDVHFGITRSYFQGAA